MSMHFRKLSLSTVITLGLAVLIVPVMVFILVFAYWQNSTSIHTLLDDRIKRSQQNSRKSAENWVHSVAGTLKVVSEMVAAYPDFFKTEGSCEVLYQGLISAEQIHGIHVSFEDGYYRAVSRIDADRRRLDPRIPQNANWSSAYFDADGPGRRHHRSLFETWPIAIDTMDEHFPFNGRDKSHYIEAKNPPYKLAIGDPEISKLTGCPIMYVGAPVVRNGKFIGIVGASISLDVLSRFLNTNRVSTRSISLIAHQNGNLIVQSSPENDRRKVGKPLAFASLAESNDVWVRQSYRQRIKKGSKFQFTTSTGEELSVSFLDFPEESRRPWQVVVITPTKDFVGDLQSKSRIIVAVIALLLVLEVVLICFLAKGLSRGVESVTRQFQAIQELQFIECEMRSSNIREVADLQSGFALLRNALKTFAQYVPLDVVRQLVESGQPLGLGVEPRPLTIFFSDLENFSSIAEKMAPHDLLKQVSEYFSAVTEALAQEHGTVDKFIGDAVMAFWGAPLPREDHVLAPAPAPCGRCGAWRN